MPKHREENPCAGNCSTPRIYDFNANAIPQDKMDIIEAMPGDSKNIKACNYCDTVWVEYQHSVGKTPWGGHKRIIRIRNMQTGQDVWRI